MYSTCIFCHSALGANESVEHFPIGRRLAFDAARGRLWVVCRRCERWNLSPLEERWEAIEECERLFGDTRLRVSTDNIGLARLRDRLELVRIGSPQRPEMAAWRYGDQFGRRRRKHLLWTGAGIAAAAGVVIAGPVTGLVAGSGWGLWNLVSTANSAYQARRVRARIPLPDLAEPARIRLRQLNRVSITTDENGWSLLIPFEAPADSPLIQTGRLFHSQETIAQLRGDFALYAAAKLLPAMNAAGAKRTEVDDAVRLIGQVAEPARLFDRYATQAPAPTRRRSSSSSDKLTPDAARVADLPKEVRLALEMATHEDSERRALEGELTLLHAAWQEAEEIAAIADDMFVPEETRLRLTKLKRGDAAD